MKKRRQRSAQKKLNVPDSETQPKQMADHASQQGLCVYSLHTPATPLSLSLITHTHNDKTHNDAHSSALSAN